MPLVQSIPPSLSDLLLETTIKVPKNLSRNKRSKQSRKTQQKQEYVLSHNLSLSLAKPVSQLLISKPTTATTTESNTYFDEEDLEAPDLCSSSYSTTCSSNNSDWSGEEDEYLSVPSSPVINEPEMIVTPLQPVESYSKNLKRRVREKKYPVVEQCRVDENPLHIDEEQGENYKFEPTSSSRTYRKQSLASASISSPSALTSKLSRSASSNSLASSASTISSKSSKLISAATRNLTSLPVVQPIPTQQLIQQQQQQQQRKQPVKLQTFSVSNTLLSFQQRQTSEYILRENPKFLRFYAIQRNYALKKKASLMVSSGSGNDSLVLLNHYQHNQNIDREEELLSKLNRSVQYLNFEKPQKLRIFASMQRK